ncbi:phosphatidylglycerolphosphate synthase mitochondrial [Leishmania donovani]|uniref:CDP-diacylglycerol--glycerol-3-phosphate 3-phosphatidyltransferase n=1 Tax=Leishmania donovani TaxID=5661 RepID=A0A6J8F438_LEIDO|nr:phosphatidylglycerolphosphate synthase mitochondrial [Leishmania donovani]VDZ42154.1 phosphatidylglycerolphosphate_synthase_mitochondrial_putative/GeneDB:LmjF.07.0200 [Leishmania donovani]
MPTLLVYLVILAIAAGVTFALFGEVGEADVAPADALELFATATPTASGATTFSLEATTEAKTGGDDCGARKSHAAPGDESGIAHIQSLLMKCGVPPQQQEMISFLGRHCCVLPVKSHTVRVLNHPAVFYEELKKRVMAAQRSITLSALYIGDGPLSRAFVACLEERVRWAAAGGHPFSITILLDYNRMQDRKNLVSLKTLMELAQQTASTAPLPVDAAIAGASASSPTTRSPSTLGSSSIFADGERDAEEDEAVRGDSADGASATTTTTAAAASTGVRVRLFLYQNPSKWNGVFAPFGRAKEVLGVQHTKIFVFDQRHTILTGANLSDDYFATRMDRYMIVEDNVLVARWFTQLVRTANRMSHPVVCRKEFAEQLTSGADTCASRTPNKSGALGHSSAAFLSSRMAAATANGSAPEPLQSPLRWVVEKVNRAVSPPLTSLVSQREGSPTLHRKSDLVILANALQMDPSVDTEAFCARANALLHDFAAWARRLCAAAKVDWGCYDTFLFPTVQAGRAGVYHDSVIVKQLLRLSTAEDHIFLASPYLNMHASFVDEVLHGTSYVDCITASVQTNGWNGQKGMAGRIPLFYLQLERSFYYLMKAYNCLRRVHIREFSVKGLTFHAKGLWFMGRRCCSGAAAAAASPPGKDGEGDARQRHDDRGADAAAADPCPPESISAPYLVAYGSTNYGYRSVHKDVEAEAFLLTTNDALRETLRQELLFLLQQSVPVTEAQFVGTAMGRFQPVISLIAHLGHDFL